MSLTPDKSPRNKTVHFAAFTKSCWNSCHLSDTGLKNILLDLFFDVPKQMIFKVAFRFNNLFVLITMNEYQVSNIAIVWPSSWLRWLERRIRACVVLNVSGSNPVLHTTFYQCHFIFLYWFALLFCPLAQVSRSVRIRKKV